MSTKIVRLRPAKIVRNATSHSKGRRGNDAYRVREHLTEGEMDKLLARPQAQSARSPGLADRTGHLPTRPEGL